MLFDISTIYSTTEYTLDRIGSYRNWWDALLLYFRYIKQSRIQENVRTFSNDIFMEKAMSWGNDRLRHAKNVLKELWLIETIVKRDEKWRVSHSYVKVNFIIDTGAILSTTPETRNQCCPEPVEPGTNTLVLKDKYPSTKYKYTQENFDLFFKSYPKRVNKVKCEMLYKECLNKVSHEHIMEWLSKYLKANEKENYKYVVHPERFLKYERYNDVYEIEKEVKQYDWFSYVDTREILGENRLVYRREYDGQLWFFGGGNFNTF
jgi:hypothetical protein